jgi:hypothetical protein
MKVTLVQHSNVFARNKFLTSLIGDFENSSFEDELFSRTGRNRTN